MDLNHFVIQVDAIAIWSISLLTDLEAMPAPGVRREFSEVLGVGPVQVHHSLVKGFHKLQVAPAVPGSVYIGEIASEYRGSRKAKLNGIFECASTASVEQVQIFLPPCIANDMGRDSKGRAREEANSALL